MPATYLPARASYSPLPPCPRPPRFVDDTNVYRVTIHKTFEGNLTTKPINGWGWGLGGWGCCLYAGGPRCRGLTAWVLVAKR